ncbi:MAG: hypothetical protein ABS91_02950 [Thiobacillus sp. SCN 64-35]|nr:MAG: hypothetical protein ABS91_02950 [Thiobacillus sp. SCN 64-35]
MSDSPLLSKMDALLKKHRGSAEGEQGGAATELPIPEEQAAPPDAWLPVLTHVIERGTPPSTPPEPAAPATDARPVSASPFVRAETPAAQVSSSAVSDTLAEQLMSELAPRLSEVMEKQVATELRKNIDQTVSSLLSQLDVNVREIVRDAVAEKLKHPRDPSS